MCIQCRHINVRFGEEVQEGVWQGDPEAVLGPGPLHQHKRQEGGQSHGARQVPDLHPRCRLFLFIPVEVDGGGWLQQRVLGLFNNSTGQRVLNDEDQDVSQIIRCGKAWSSKNHAILSGTGKKIQASHNFPRKGLRSISMLVWAVRPPPLSWGIFDIWIKETQAPPSSPSSLRHKEKKFKSSEMDSAEISFIGKAFIKMRGADQISAPHSLMTTYWINLISAGSILMDSTFNSSICVLHVQYFWFSLLEMRKHSPIFRGCFI